jgi:hypothetical protein
MALIQGIWNIPLLSLRRKSKPQIFKVVWIPARVRMSVFWSVLYALYIDKRGIVCDSFRTDILDAS